MSGKSGKFGGKTVLLAVVFIGMAVSFVIWQVSSVSVKPRKNMSLVRLHAELEALNDSELLFSSENLPP